MAHRKEHGVRGAGRGGAEGQGGGDAARGSVGRGQNASGPRAGARAGHGGLRRPAGPRRGQPLVVALADRGPGPEAALCGGWSWGLPTCGDHDDAEAPLVPVRDGVRGP